LCGNPVCPLVPRLALKSKTVVSKDFFGPSYNIFVGRHGYPNVHIGPLTAVEKLHGIDSPGEWFGMEYGSVVELRSMLVRSKQPANVKAKTRFVEENQLLALASKPVDVELLFKSHPVYSVKLSDIVQPMGPSAELDKMRIAENVPVLQRVDSIVNDDLKAGEAVNELYVHGEDVYKITGILSSGVLGSDQRLVPTRWSITAVDDIVAKQLIVDIKQYSCLNEYFVYSSEYLGNHFEILFMPGSWEFENFEAWAPGSLWARGIKQAEILEEYEPNSGRKKYAELQGGGYYASRFGVLEALHGMRRQARVVVFREISEKYTVPLGVWVVRETVRAAFKNPVKSFSSLNEALKYIGTRLRLPIVEYVNRSKILRQKRLWDFSQHV
jgi:hypothetical protein